MTEKPKEPHPLAVDVDHGPEYRAPYIFYAVHADDEAIAMAGEMIKAKRSGRPVFVVLLTNDHPRVPWRDPKNEEERLSPEFDFYCKMNGLKPCDSPAHYGQIHDFNLRTKHRSMWTRRVEFMEAVMQLDINQIFLEKDAEGLNERPILYNEDSQFHYYRFMNEIVDVIKSYDRRFPGASHRMVQGEKIFPHVSHIACGDAGMAVKLEKTESKKHFDIKFFRVYVYGQAPEKRTAQHTSRLDKEEHEKKVNALEEYKKVNADAGRYGIGYHTVPELIDAAMRDNCEYCDDEPEESWLKKHLFRRM